MTKYNIMSYNIEHMRKLFKGGKIAGQFENRVKSLVKVINHVDPHILGICEASNKITHHNIFLEKLKGGYKLAKSDLKRGKQDLVIYYKEPFELETIDPDPDFYNSWLIDIDENGIREEFSFERKPLEAIFKIGNYKVVVILVYPKSKGVFTPSDLFLYQKLALANRKKMVAQAKKIRERIDYFMENHPDYSIIVMGDFNDDPGMDYHERILGASGVETMMGSIYEPEKIMHNTLWYLSKTDLKNLWTCEFPAPVVNSMGKIKLWLDHILVSPNMMGKNGVKYIKDSGKIVRMGEDTEISSDHLPIYCSLEI